MCWCFYGSCVRNGVLANGFTWSLIGEVLYKDGKFERIVKIFDMGFDPPDLYSLVIDSYSKLGNLEAALLFLNQMSDRGIEPSFSTLSSILDGACKYEHAETIEKAMSLMVDKECLPELDILEYDSVIQKLSDHGKTYAAELFVSRARDENVVLQDSTYGCMLQALSKEGRLKNAIEIYRTIFSGKMLLNDSYYAFVNALCNERPSDEVFQLLKDLIERGFYPSEAQQSRFISSLFDKRWWKEANELVNMILGRGYLPDSSSCCALAMHFCSRKQIDLAIGLHDKLKKLGGTFNVRMYNVLLRGLFKGVRVEEALGMFDYMRMKEILDSESFTIMIDGLCRVGELSKAMKLHDEMMKLGLKPDTKTYKRLISSFV